LKGEDDEDIPTIEPSPPTVDDPIVAAQDKSNDEIRIGPITQARAKLLQQQVNSLLIESDIYCNENFILPKSLFICMIRFIGEKGVRGRRGRSAPQAWRTSPHEGYQVWMSTRT
jgi:hypothetical protein